MDEKKEAMKRIAPCGLHCGKCFAFTEGTIHEEAGKLRRDLGNFTPYAARFSKALDPVFEKYLDFAELLDYIADADCGGCRKEKCKFYKSCKVRACTESKGVDFCYECGEFPCDHTGLDENLYRRSVEINRRIADIGIVAYYNEVKDKPRY